MQYTLCLHTAVHVIHQVFSGMGSSRTFLDLEDGSRTKNLGLEEVWLWP